MTTDNLGAFDPISALRAAHTASVTLSSASGVNRSRAVQAMAQALCRRQNDILEANTLDLEISREMAISELLLEWLKLTPERLQNVVQILNRLSELPDPIGRVMPANFQTDRAQTYSQLMPLGVIALIYEAFPELSAIAAGLCIKTANCLILKGSSEASHSNLAIAETLQQALEDEGLPIESVQLLPAEDAPIRDLIIQDRYLNLVIPYGRPSLVQQVVRQATAPVLKSAMGNCYLYWSPSGSLEMTRSMIIDSHLSEPDPVNAIEKVLIHRQQNPASLVMLWDSLREKGFEIRGDMTLANEFPSLRLVEDSEWNQAYLDRIISFRIVDGLPSAINCINHYSSGHADCLVTESYQESRQFALGVNSATTYINASPRFYRNPKRGDAIFLGMSNQKGHRRGLIGLETLTTVKHIVQGTGLM
ncbi:glutamate-5-semialdehyde dehydrogenase [Leptolyngbya sp. FACHB-17]|uniref:glutamate-5-semialdehyde dehydrogenase n=1 Tax=unclassified Leptolyngbya TaxID=2650499 RepID=UPI001681288E|nr:glutamate-5-semialdehyde dehydrogenase [Leptolyngbya sp. FACHB-17]MBD2079280.1 glutamate-5-semialdehyde dehydrogenase [Leptolyngbya sp. FACHB-17]